MDAHTMDAPKIRAVGSYPLCPLYKAALTVLHEHETYLDMNKESVLAIAGCRAICIFFIAGLRPYPTSLVRLSPSNNINSSSIQQIAQKKQVQMWPWLRVAQTHSSS
jgi:hypothetical protein